MLDVDNRILFEINNQSVYNILYIENFLLVILNKQKIEFSFN